MKIYAPVKNSNGTWASVRFVNGVGETDNPTLIAWFIEHGYEVVDESKILPVEEVDIPTNAGVDELDKIELPIDLNKETALEDMTPNELRDWAKANGYGAVIKNTRNKEKLLELIRG